MPCKAYKWENFIIKHLVGQESIDFILLHFVLLKTAAEPSAAPKLWLQMRSKLLGPNVWLAGNWIFTETHR